MAAVETEIINPSDVKSPTLKRYIDDICSLWILLNEEEINTFIELASNKHRAIKFVAAISGTDTTLLDTKFVCVCNGDGLKKDAILEVGKNFKLSETLFTSCHPTDARKGFIKGKGFASFDKQPFKRHTLRKQYSIPTWITLQRLPR